MEKTFETLIADTVKQAVREVLQEQRNPSRAKDTPVTINVKQAAAKANVSPNTIYDWLHREDCDFAIPVGRKKVILYDKFMAWLEKQTGQGGVGE